jgi:hypothetical protein
MLTMRHLRRTVVPMALAPEALQFSSFFGFYRRAFMR